MRVLLLSAYAAASHRHWQETLVQMFAEWTWTVLTLPPRHFSWRIRGNPLYWSQAERETLEADYDLLLATSMVDLATLRGLVPALAKLPALLYFHENQFAYPAGNARHGLLEAQVVSLYAALAAQRLLFNSSYNRDTFLSGCDELLSRLPDKVPGGVVRQLEERSCVVPVPLDTNAATGVVPDWPGASRSGSVEPLRLLWTGRFEHDKGGDELLAVLEKLEASGEHYELALVGQQFRNSPQAFHTVERCYAHRLVHFGYIESRARYLGLLRGADIVLSTARHEFQGLAVMEAVAAGALPVVPDSLAYPEFYSQQYRYADGAAGAAALVLQLRAGLRSGAARVPDLSGCAPANLAGRYRAEFLAAAGRQDSQ